MPSENTNIGWADGTWNPIHGCFKTSQGCANCYAAALSNRMGHTPEPWTVQNVSENLKLQDHHMDFPRRQSQPQRIFVNSMSDLFLPKQADGETLLPDAYIHKIMDVIEDCPRHAFLALTKHGAESGGTHSEIPRLIDWDQEYGRWPDNLYMGVSVEAPDRTYRADVLRQTSAAYKWISFEPLVEQIRDIALNQMDWIVVGGESGDNYREMPHHWARRLRDMAKTREIAYFFKQSAARNPESGTALELANGGSKEYRELPPLPDDMAENRPSLANQVVG